EAQRNVPPALTKQGRRQRGWNHRQCNSEIGARAGSAFDRIVFVGRTANTTHHLSNTTGCGTTLAVISDQEPCQTVTIAATTPELGFTSRASLTREQHPGWITAREQDSRGPRTRALPALARVVPALSDAVQPFPGRVSSVEVTGAIESDAFSEELLMAAILH